MPPLPLDTADVSAVSLDSVNAASCSDAVLSGRTLEFEVDMQDSLSHEEAQPGAS
jgi:hypothetical protein